MNKRVQERIKNKQMCLQPVLRKPPIYQRKQSTNESFTQSLQSYNPGNKSQYPTINAQQVQIAKPNSP
ncbi:hypothetical protein LguiB_013413 [Lonicera macranthoides]